ncbi:MAG: hypothetical protein CVU89_07240 [Firmicutes bacterium HGW-Firmicutes-14]|nr:MAG: hypothetical protein CVU89_07240 [Firmicutes bacterium HGW-Firmicutes-14]
MCLLELIYTKGFAFVSIVAPLGENTVGAFGEGTDAGAVQRQAAEPLALQRLTDPAYPLRVEVAWTGETGGGSSDFALEAHNGNKSNSVVYINPNKTLFYTAILKDFKRKRSTLSEGALEIIEVIMKIKNNENHSGTREAKDYALRFISYRPRTVWEVKQRLTIRGYKSDIISGVIEFLNEYDFLNDEKFARMWVRNRTNEKPCGRYRIYCELRQKGVAKDIIEKALAGFSQEKEHQMSVSLVEKKCRKTSFDYKKLQGFLLRRGFDPEIVKKVLADYIKNHSE